MPSWATSWVPPPVPGGDPIATPATPAPTDGTDWSWLQADTQSLQFWGEWWSNLPHELGNLFNSFAPTNEAQLAGQIYEKMGPSSLPRGLHQMDPNMLIAQQAAHAAMQSPSYREQLVSSLGWNAKNPHVAYWVQNGGGLPQDPTGTGAGAGVPPGTTTTTPGTPASSALAGVPFDPKAWGGRKGDPGFLYGAVLPAKYAAAAGVDRQWGVDYAMALGTQLPSPFTGTIQSAGWDGPYGNTVVVKLSNGFTYRVAHLSAMNVKAGDPVAVGQLLGLVGSTGNSSGPHVLIEMKDASGKPIDPTPIIDRLLKGDTSAASRVLGDYASATASIEPGGGTNILTSDGHLIYPGSNDFNVFVAAASLWRKRYGGDPPWTFVSGLIASGNTTAEQIQTQMDLMSSDIKGMTWGQRDQFSADANAAAAKAFSRPLPDSTIKQLAAEGITTSGQLQGWVQSHPASAIDNADYATIYDRANTQTQKYWQQPPSPDMVVEINKRMKQGPS